MKNLNIFSLLLLTIIIWSCTKKKDEIYPRKPTITAGEETNFLIKVYNKTLNGGYNQIDKYQIDIDEDEIFDIEFLSQTWGSSGLGIHSKLSMNIINPELEILRKNQIDSLIYRSYKFLHMDSTQIIVSVSNNYLYNSFQKGDSIINIFSNTSLKSMNEKEIFSINDLYSNESTLFYKSPKENHTWYYLADTLFYVFTTSYYNLPKLLKNKNFFLGLKFKNDLRLGWLELKYNGGSTIDVIRTGVQK